MRLIDADALIEYGTGGVTSVALFTLAEINNAPTIDPVHAAGGCYCRECTKWDAKPETWSSKGFGYCRECMMDCPTDHFCSYGERKNE